MPIKNWNFHELHMDYQNCNCGHGQPSDIDMFYIGRDKTLILGEIKNEDGEFKNGQLSLLENLANGWSKHAIILCIVHDKKVQNGDTVVDVAPLFVQAMYDNKTHEWMCPERPTTVKEVILAYS